MANQPMDKTGAYPAKIDNNFATVQAAVFAKAGISVPNMTFANSSLDKQSPQPVSIRMKNGTVLAVHHDVALQRVLRGDATLV